MSPENANPVMLQRQNSELQGGSLFPAFLRLLASHEAFAAAEKENTQ
jgi:hypothetical protein